MWFIYWDPCGLACYAFGWVTLHYVHFVLDAYIVWPAWGHSPLALVHTLVFTLLLGLAAAAYIRAAATDPGSVACNTADEPQMPNYENLVALIKAGNVSDDELSAACLPRRRYCDKCKVIKPPRAHHCSTCGRCIQKMDHHCPWVNNCVGTNNMRFFLQFLLYIFLGGVYTTSVIGFRIYCGWRNPAAYPTPDLATLVNGAIAGILGIFFAIFTCAMAVDQYEGMVTNTTGIESMKGWQEESRSLKEGMTDVCGEPCGWAWFFPTTLLKVSSAYYEWKASDDADAYDMRDPLIQRHFSRMQARIDKVVAEQEQRKRHHVPSDSAHSSASSIPPSALSSFADASSPAGVGLSTPEAEAALDGAIPPALTCARPVPAAPLTKALRQPGALPAHGAGVRKRK